MKAPEDNISIVVVGNMNPRIHSPSWYLIMKLITHEEHEFAVSPLADLVVTPVISQFKFNDITIKCQPDRWEIQTVGRERLQDIGRITYQVFDEYLMHTPVVNLGVNFNYYRETGRQDVPRFLASKLAHANPWVGNGDLLSGEFSVLRTVGRCQNRTQVRPLPPPELVSWISLLNNYEYTFRGPTTGHFSVREIIETEFPAHEIASLKYVESMIAAVSALEAE